MAFPLEDPGGIQARMLANGHDVSLQNCTREILENNEYIRKGRIGIGAGSGMIFQKMGGGERYGVVNGVR